MNIFLKTLLAIHVILGVAGVIALCAVWMNLLKQKLPLRFLRSASFLGFLFFLASWFIGGYYYAMYYGAKVKPIIIKGTYAWGHTLFTESKEHVFLFLPFLAAAMFIALLMLGDHIETDEKLKRALTYLTAVIVIIGIIITLSGIAISGAVR